MMYIDFEAGNKEYKLRLNTRNVVALEKMINRNPVAIFFDGENERVPTITEMVAILHNALQPYQHGITLNDAYDIFDTYIADGHTTIEFIKILTEVFQVSGLIPKKEEEVKND